jgi:YggT family protein
MLDTVYLALRLLVAAAFGLSLVVALTHWLVREQKINGFGAWARGVRRLSDPVLKPIERRLLRAGGNPQQAPLWLAGLTLVFGLVALWFFRWLVGSIYSLVYLSQGSPRLWLAQIIHWVFSILQIAIIVRVIGSWIGANEHTRWMRPFVVLTEWLMAPLRRIIPPFGMIDISPLVAYFLLVIGERAAMGLI